MNLRYIDWIWHIRGSLPLPPGQSAREAFERLDPLFRRGGTSREWMGDRLTFSKKDQAAQDEMSIFDSGVLQIERGSGVPVLHYHLISRALLACFLAPLLFLAFAGIIVVKGQYEKPSPEAAAKAEAEKKKAEQKLSQVPMNPIDVFLGAPKPEKPKAGEQQGRRSREATPTAAYVFMGIFAILYIVGRILEAWLIRRRFEKRLYDVPTQAGQAPPGLAT
ncbi:MAG: hypothetical protein RL702_128 [Pseudomonadota bacterium]|nr:hypothetical protein [Novosphingobium sp.]HPZ47194.1 hypothetical protein [Novosphingobium sp.]HQD99419.1 hypothetical protein [Novosphingobium sp.]HQQ07091.1 hypothetical protein [Novosphingobium sp.]